MRILLIALFLVGCNHSYEENQIKQLATYWCSCQGETLTTLTYESWYSAKALCSNGKEAYFGPNDVVLCTRRTK